MSIIELAQKGGQLNEGEAAGLAIGALLLFGIGFIFYVVPIVVAWARHVPNIGSIAVITIFLGWTMIGWVVALAMALRTVPKEHREYVESTRPRAFDEKG